MQHQIDQSLFESLLCVVTTGLCNFFLKGRFVFVEHSTVLLRCRLGDEGIASCFFWAAKDRESKGDC